MQTSFMHVMQIVFLHETKLSLSSFLSHKAMTYDTQRVKNKL